MKKFIAFASKSNGRKQFTHNSLDMFLSTLTEYRFYNTVEELDFEEHGLLISRFHSTTTAFVLLYSIEEVDGKIVVTLVHSFGYRVGNCLKYAVLNEDEVKVLKSGESVQQICMDKFENDAKPNLSEALVVAGWNTLPCFVVTFKILVYIPNGVSFVPVFGRFYDAVVHETFVSNTTYTIQVSPTYSIAKEVSPLDASRSD